MRKMIAALTVLALAVAGWLILRPESGAERVKGMIAWDPSCADVVIRAQDDWPAADEHALVACEHLGPLVEYARFESEAELRRDLLAMPPSQPLCLAGLEVAVDYLDRGQFERLCRDLRGVKIDAIDDGAEPPWFSERDDPAHDAWLRDSAAAQKRALERHWRL